MKVFKTIKSYCAGQTNLKSLALIPIALLLSACASFHHAETGQSVDTLDYQQVANVTEQSTGSSALAGNQLRLKAVGQAALALGAQGGLAYEANKINDNLLLQAEHLRTIFNFDALILNHNILPPVLIESTDTLNLSDPDTIRTASRSFKIDQAARFVTAPPTWRDYLLMAFDKPELPDQTLLPKTAAEQTIWREQLKVGWVSGLQQADQIFSQNLSRLKQDYEGMVLYRKLLTEHMVTPPYVAATDLGVTGDSQQLNIGDKILRISALPGLQTNIQKWTPVLDTKNQE